MDCQGALGLLIGAAVLGVICGLIVRFCPIPFPGHRVRCPICLRDWYTTAADKLESEEENLRRLRALARTVNRRGKSDASRQ
jgi:hypothetical protein